MEELIDNKILGRRDKICSYDLAEQMKAGIPGSRLYNNSKNEGVSKESTLFSFTGI